jgi:hypothetical protein
MSTRPPMMVCGSKPEHGFWPAVHHPFALLLAERDHPRNPKFQRMIDGQCLICGSGKVRVTP